MHARELKHTIACSEVIQIKIWDDKNLSEFCSYVFLSALASLSIYLLPLGHYDVCMGVYIE